MIVVAGEALIDLVPTDAGDLRPLLGGSPFNVAVGLGRLGSDAGYVGRLSTDAFGEKLAHRLGDEGVSLHLTARTEAPTTLAVVHLDDRGRASYRFYLEATSAAGLAGEDVDGWMLADAAHISLGAVTLDAGVAGATLTAMLTQERGDTLLSLDPNVRPGVIADLRGYATRMDQLVRNVDLVKVSDEDLQVLYPGRRHGDIAARWAAAGVTAVVVTRGEDGAEVHLAGGGSVEVAAEPVEVVDTVGAGDAFTAGLLHALDRRDALSRQRLSGLDAAAWENVLTTAVRVAAVTCTREGADPPRTGEF